MRTAALLAALGRIPPEAWDAIVGQGPVLQLRWEHVALNPQPLPPRDPFFVGAALMAHEVAGLAIRSDLRGEFSADLVSQVVDDWCGTPWPRRLPWPWPGPRPDEGPVPDPWRIDVGRAIGAVVFASVGSRLADGDVRTALLEGAERLAEVAGQG